MQNRKSGVCLKRVNYEVRDKTDFEVRTGCVCVVPCVPTGLLETHFLSLLCRKHRFESYFKHSQL